MACFQENNGEYCWGALQDCIWNHSDTLCWILFGRNHLRHSDCRWSYLRMDKFHFLLPLDRHPYCPAGTTKAEVVRL